MTEAEKWKLLERLADPSTPPAEWQSLMARVNAEADLRQLWRGFRALQQWPQELQRSAAPDLEPLHHRIRSEMEALAVEREMRRAFPWLAAAAIAASVLLGLVNLNRVEDPASNPLDEAFGLPNPSFEASLIADL